MAARARDHSATRRRVPGALARKRKRPQQPQQPRGVETALPLADRPGALRRLRRGRLEGKDGKAPRRFLVPRARWKDLPSWMWYVSVRGPQRRHVRGQAPLMWEYTRSARPWPGSVGLPALEDDPLFQDPDRPGLLSFRPRARRAQAAGVGSVIVVPGGNYEFLASQEGAPVASWLARAGFHAYVLRYRLLPKYGIDDALADLRDAVRQVRVERGGPVCVMGFSAGAHLCASFCARGLGRRFRRGARLREGSAQLSQVLLYPCLDASEWADPDKAAWWGWNFEACEATGRGAELAAYDLINARPVADASPSAATFLVHSVEDTVVKSAHHSDLYARRRRGPTAPPFVYVRGSFGDHGFGVTPIWSQRCLAWLRERGFRGAA